MTETHKYVPPTFDWKSIYGTVTVSPALFSSQRTPEEMAVIHARRRAEWDENLAAGLVPVEWDYVSYYDEAGEAWKLVEQFEDWHDVTWIRPELWQTYLFVAHLTDVIDEEIRKGPDGTAP